MKNIVDHINEAAGEKDYSRIDGIITKAKGSTDKELQLSQNMAKKITGKEKSENRFLAAQEKMGNNHPATQVFLKRAIELGNDHLEEFLVDEKDIDSGDKDADPASADKSVEKVLASRNKKMQAFGVETELRVAAILDLDKAIEFIAKDSTQAKYKKAIFAKTQLLDKYNPTTGKAGNVTISNIKTGVAYLVKQSTKSLVKNAVFIDKNAKHGIAKIDSTLNVVPSTASSFKGVKPTYFTIVDWCVVEDLQIMLEEHDSPKPVVHVITDIGELSKFM